MWVTIFGLVPVGYIFLVQMKYFSSLLRRQNDVKYSTHKGCQLSGWLRGVRRRTQISKLAPLMRSQRAFWSTNVGVGSNTTPDRIL
jgi:hypothetical protein